MTLATSLTEKNYYQCHFFSITESQNCHYSDCPNAECRGAYKVFTEVLKLGPSKTNTRGHFLS